MTNWKLNTPVAFVIFNRPDTTARVFEAIRQAQPPKLFVIADGPHPDKPGENERCAAARSVVDRVDWECDIFKNYSDTNLGCRNRVSTGLDWVFGMAEEAIILEDDCVPNVTFFEFCEELLEYHRENQRIMGISGDNFQFGNNRSPHSYYFSRYPHCWGWATWKRAWLKYDDSMKAWPSLRNTTWLQDLLQDNRAARYWWDIFQKNHEGFNSWNYSWFFACWLHDGLTILPNVNLVSNIGSGEDATHTQKLGILDNMPTQNLFFPLQHPGTVERNIEADKFTEKVIISGSIPQRDFIEMPLQALRVDLGCGINKPKGYVGIDCFPGPGVDIVTNLADRFPLGEQLADEVRAYDFIEHLYDGIHTLNEIWRICKPNATVDISVPSTDGRGAFQDPTHVSFWNIHSFYYYCIDHPQYLDLCQRYGFSGMFKINRLESIDRSDKVSYVKANLQAIKPYLYSSAYKRVKNYYQTKDTTDSPLVSVCIPTYNGSKYIIDAIESAFDQSYDNIEIIISDDGSSDNTLSIIEDLVRKSPFPYVVIKHNNLGIAQNWNVTALQAKGKYIKFLHQDDILEKTCVADLVNLAEQDDDVGLVFSQRGLIADAKALGNKVCANNYRESQAPHTFWSNLKPIQNGKDLLNKHELLSSLKNGIGEPSTVLIRRSVLGQIGYFDTKFQQLIDLEMWFRIMATYKIGFVDKKLSYWRLHESQQTSRNFENNTSALLMDVVKLYENVVNNSAYPDQLRREAATRYQLIVQNRQSQASRKSHVNTGHVNSRVEEIHALDKTRKKITSSITLFTTAKLFDGHSAVIQRNAVQSWNKLIPHAEVIIFGDEIGVKEISRELGLHHVPDVRCNEFGTPLLSDMFKKAQALASNDIIVYINADIILLSDFIPAIQKVAERFPKFLAVGQRWNLDQETLLEFDKENWEQELRQQVKAKGKLELGCAIDYFAFTKNLWPDFPDFAVGRPTWDNYTIYRTIADGFPVVDLTDQVMVVHQNHDYSHIPTGEVAHHKGVETDRNRALAIECIGLSQINTIYAYVGYTNHATWKLTETGLIRTSDADKIEKLCRYLKQNDPELVRQVVQLLKDYQANSQNSDLEKMLQNIAAELARFLLHLPSENCQKYKLASLGRAYQSLTRCLSQFSNRPNVSPVDQVSIYLKLAKIYLTQGSLEDASNACSEAIKLQPNHAESYYLISQVLQQQNKLTAATLARQKAEQLS